MEPVMTLLGHTENVCTFDVSSDGKLIASGSEDRTVKLWDAHTGECVRTMAPHSGAVRVVCISPDGKLIASSSDDRGVKVWDACTGVSLCTIRCLAKVSTVDFSSDGKLIACVGNNSTVNLWEAHTGAHVRTIVTHSGVIAIRFSPDGRFIASGDQDQTVSIWDVQTGVSVLTTTRHAGYVSTVDFSPDGKLISSGSSDDTIKVWDVQTGACVRTIATHSRGVLAMRFSPDGRFIASGGSSQRVAVWDAQTGVCIRTMKDSAATVRTLCFSPDGKLVAPGSENKTVKVWDTSNLKSDPGIMLSAVDEAKYCKEYWKIAESDGSGALDAERAMVFFSSAGLSMSVLDRMWEEVVMAPGKRALNYDDFVLALRFIALVQTGEEASLARAQQGSYLLRAKLDIPGSNPFLVGARTPLETTRHDDYWKLVGADGSDEVDVQKAVALLSKSGLRNRVLNEVWGLATNQGMFSSLDTERFNTVLRLVAMAQKGMKLDLDEAVAGDMELIAEFKIEATTPVPEPVNLFEWAPGTDLESLLAEIPLDDLTCEQLARVLEEVLRVDITSVRDVRERKVNGEALRDMKEFQEFVQLSFPDKKKIEKWLARRKSYELFEEYLLRVLGGNMERAERACALLLEFHTVSNLEEWLWFRKQPSKRRSMREIVRLFPELGTWPGGPDAAEWN